MQACNTSKFVLPMSPGAYLRIDVRPRHAVVQATRREAGVQMISIGLGLFGVAQAAIADEMGAKLPTSNSSSSSSSTVSGIQILPLNSKVKEALDRRDEAMAYKCTGGMFDCDGDRSEFAHKQYMDWLESGGVPKRIRDGRPDGPRSY